MTNLEKLEIDGWYLYIDESSEGFWCYASGKKYDLFNIEEYFPTAEAVRNHVMEIIRTIEERHETN